MENLKYVLEMENITKEFPGVKALDNVQLKLKPGTKKIGVLYNPSEQNSAVQVQEIQKIAKNEIEETI